MTIEKCAMHKHGQIFSGATVVHACVKSGKFEETHDIILWFVLDMSCG